MNYKQFWITILTVAALSFIGGILVCRNNHKVQEPVVYDLTHLVDSVLAANKTIDTVIIEKQGAIKYEKAKIKNRYVAVDSLSYDSLYKLWVESARQYEQVFH